LNRTVILAGTRRVIDVANKRRSFDA